MSQRAQAVVAEVPVAATGGAARLRDKSIDAVRGLAIILVVLGHAKGIPHAFTILVYSFHVPLFFVLSGWVGVAFGRLRLDGQGVMKLVRTLLVPYLCFFLLGYAYWLMTRHIGAKALRWGDRPWWEPLRGLVDCLGPDLYVQPPLWFLPALFSSTVAFLFLRRMLATKWIVLLVGVVSWLWIILFPGSGYRLPLTLDVLPVSLFFYATGAWAAAAGPRLLPRTRNGNLLALVVLGFPWVLIAWSNGRADVNMLEFGQSPFAFYAAALLGTAMTFCVGRLAQNWPGLQWIGRNTLLILGTHILVFFVLSGIAAMAGGFGADGPGFGWALFVSVFALLVAVPMRWLVGRYAPWMIGLRPTAAPA